MLRASIKEVKRNIVIIEAKLYNKDGEVCTEAVCTYFTFSHEKSKDEMHFDKCDVEPEEILSLIWNKNWTFCDKCLEVSNECFTFVALNKRNMKYTVAHHHHHFPNE